MYQVKSGNKTYQVEPAEGENTFVLNGNISPLDLKKIGENKYHVIRNNKGYSVELVKVDKEEKLVALKINGQVYEYSIKDKMDLLLEKMGLNNLASAKVSQVKAPMPGLVHEILVEAGGTVKKGDGLLILEAMKMENVIKSPVDGEIKSVVVKTGAAVDKNQVLVEFK